MRSGEQINNIKKTFCDPYIVDNFITGHEIDQLEKMFDGSCGKLYKNTGPVTLDIKPYLEHTIFRKIFDNIHKQIGDFELNTGFFFHTDYPHIIHNDDSFDLPDNIYKAIVVPLKIYGDYIKPPELCFFDQCYFHGPSKFFNMDENLPTCINKQIYSYENVDGLLKENVIDDATYEQHFTHMKKNWLYGLSIKSILPWVPGSCVIFDSVRLHCSTDFRKLNINSKLAISIFTRKI